MEKIEKTEKREKGGSDIVSAMQSLKRAHEHFGSFILERKGTRGATLFKKYKERINWIYVDFITNNLFPEIVRYGIKQEWECDVFAISAIEEKIPLLNPEQRALIEDMIDNYLKPEEYK